MSDTDIDDTPQRLLKAAGQVFGEKGYDGATVREICQLAGVKNIAAVNYYFRDKRRLYIEAVKAAICSVERLPAEFPRHASGEEKLRCFIRGMLEQMLDEGRCPWQQQLHAREMAHPTEACAELVRDNIRPKAEFLGEILRELLPEVSARQRYLVAFSIVGQCLFHLMAKPIIVLLVGEAEHKAYTLDVLADHIASFSLAAMGLAPPVGGRGERSESRVPGPTSPGSP